MPPAEFAEKLEKEHPELFIKKTGKNKTEVLGGRDKRAIIRRAVAESAAGQPVITELSLSVVRFIETRRRHLRVRSLARSAGSSPAV